MKRKEFKVLSRIGIITLLIFILLLLSTINFFKNQEITPSSNYSCEQIRECILVSASCVNEQINNNVFGLEWSFNRSALKYEQQDYYFKNCIKEKNNDNN